MTAAFAKMAKGAVAIVDDIDWSNAFFSMCDSRRLFPLCLTDNGKDNLRMRSGLVKMNHPKNMLSEITGRR